MSKEKEYNNISSKGDYTQDDLDCALSALIEATEILGNPQLMKLVKSHAKKKEKQVKSVQDIRGLANAMYDKD